MHRTIDVTLARPLIQTASEVICPHCQGPLHIWQHRDRFVFRRDGLVHQICRDKRCPDLECDGHDKLYRPLVDLRLALPRMTFGLDVVLFVGEAHLVQGRSLSELGRELSDCGVPIHQTHVGRLFRNFVALCKMVRGDQERVRKVLLEQGGIVLMVDGVQFDDRSPVLYMCWDARSGIPLFGERLEARDAAALKQFLRKVKRMGVPVLGVVTDGEKGLVPAVQAVFPEVPHQLCQTHFLKNCAKPMEQDLRQLGQSVADRMERVRQLHKRLDKSLASESRQTKDKPSQATDSAPAREPEAVAEQSQTPSQRPERGNSQEPVAQPISEKELAKQLCMMARLDARATAKAPLNPPELVRHQRLEQVRQIAHEATKKKTCPPRPGWTL
jgi:hypothetical protein